MLSWSLNEDKSIPLPLSLQAMDHRLKSTRISTSVAWESSAFRTSSSTTERKVGRTTHARRYWTVSSLRVLITASLFIFFTSCSASCCCDMSRLQFNSLFFSISLRLKNLLRRYTRSAYLAVGGSSLLGLEVKEDKKWKERSEWNEPFWWIYYYFHWIFKDSLIQ